MKSLAAVKTGQELISLNAETDLITVYNAEGEQTIMGEFNGVPVTCRIDVV